MHLKRLKIIQSYKIPTRFSAEAPLQEIQNKVVVIRVLKL